MIAPLRQSSIWLSESVDARKLSHGEESDLPAADQQFSSCPHMPGLNVPEDYLDDEGKDMRIGIVSSGFSDEEEDVLPKRWFSWRKLWLFTGPGFLMSIAYLVRC